MKYLIDADIASYYLRGKYDLLNIFGTKGFKNIRISITTVAELEVLEYKNPNSKINRSAVYSLSKQLGIIDIDRKTWTLFSQMKATTLSTGKPRGDFDILLASIAIQNNMVVVSNNIAHYDDLVQAENWIIK
jgi:predicted nucleic acid-binding protein